MTLEHHLVTLIKAMITTNKEDMQGKKYRNQLKKFFIILATKTTSRSCCHVCSLASTRNSFYSWKRHKPSCENIMGTPATQLKTWACLGGEGGTFPTLLKPWQLHPQPTITVLQMANFIALPLQLCPTDQNSRYANIWTTIIRMFLECKHPPLAFSYFWESGSHKHVPQPPPYQSQILEFLDHVMAYAAAWYKQIFSILLP